jgi:hypothetical protein
MLLDAGADPFLRTNSSGSQYENTIGALPIDVAEHEAKAILEMLTPLRRR